MRSDAGRLVLDPLKKMLKIVIRCKYLDLCQGLHDSDQMLMCVDWLVERRRGPALANLIEKVKQQEGWVGDR
jgi:hypothetical protein